LSAIFGPKKQVKTRTRSKNPKLNFLLCFMNFEVKMKPESQENGATDDDATSMAMKSCETPGCDKEARLQCPTCIKLQIQVLLDFF
jgi:hypothetical protein